MKPFYALIDCDNFYVSCERIFNYGIRGKPVVVLSNNDGCIIARSQEAKDIGIKMGDPFFKVREKLEQCKAAVYSSNYELYGDISARIMSLLNDTFPEVEVYSIDEAFVEIPGNMDTENACRDIIHKCAKWIGVPVKVGAGPTKTLAKAAAALVKKLKTPSKFKIIHPEKLQPELFAPLSLDDIWGIGAKTASRLNKIGIKDVSGLLSLDDDFIRKSFGVCLQRTAWELKGIPCIPFESCPAPRKNMCYSRSFGEYVKTFDELKESIVSYASSAAENLRRDRQKAQSVSVFILTNRFSKTQRQYANSVCITLPYPANDTPTILKYAVIGLRRIFREGFCYKKSGILLNDLVPENICQDNLFSPENPNNMRISEVIDEVNRKYGKNRLVIASSGITDKKWKLIRGKLSSRCTTRWDELPMSES